MLFSLIIPVYNRPDEIEELLESLTKQTYTQRYEVVVVEDGSTVPCNDVIARFEGKLFISYYNKPNTGPGDSRNFGMRKAQGDYYIILDSDCIIPSVYLQNISEELETAYVDCFGGPDAALDTFSNVQKAINFAMTSFLTTGGIRGKNEKLEKFQPRSFNMGLSKRAFEASGGFGNIHPGEDPDLSIRLWKKGFTTALITRAFVYHKRRIDWNKFYKQVNKFGKARPILDSWHPQYSKLTYWLPSVFVIGFLLSLILMLITVYVPVYLYILYFISVFLTAALKNRSCIIGFLALIAVCIQFYGYGSGFLKSFFRVRLQKKKPEKAFPELFFRV